MKASAGMLDAERILYSDRLALTRPSRRDFDDCVAMWADPTTTTFMGGKPFSPEQVWSRLLRHVGHWAVLGYGFWTIRERVSGAFVGEAGFYHLKRDLDPSPADCPETGWVLAPGARRKGFAREALSAALAWGDRHFEAPRTICLIDPQNSPSMNVALQCGYRESGTVRHQESELLLLERFGKVGLAESNSQARAA